MRQILTAWNSSRRSCQEALLQKKSQLRMRLRRRSRSADRTFSRPTMTGLMITVHGKEGGEQARQEKEERMDKRYHEETKSLRESDKDLKVEMQTLLRKYKLPSFCGKKLYFALFYARNVREFGLKLLTFIIGFGGIPGLVTFLVKNLYSIQRKISMLRSGVRW